MNITEAKRAVVRKYAYEQSSRNVLSEDEAIKHIVAELDHLTAKQYGYQSAAEMESALMGQWVNTTRSKHFPMRGR